MSLDQMTNETQAAVGVQEQGANAVPPAPDPNAPKKRRKKRKALKRTITIVVILAIVGAIAYGMVQLFSDNEEEQEALTEFTYRGSIQEKVEGYGITKAKESAGVTAAVKGVVNEVFYSTGDYVFAGDLLFTIDTGELDKSVEEIQQKIDELIKDRQEIYDSQSKLTITAPFSGKLISCNISEGQFVSKDTVIGEIVDDSRMRLKQYFSYAYIDEISTGMSASISIPASMTTRTGTVERINRVERVSPEGSMLFEVVIVLDNPGTLTEGTLATASIGEIYPYESGSLEYYEKKEVKAQVSGTCLSVNMIEYMKVSSGTTLAVLDSDDYDAQIKTINEDIKEEEEKMAEELEKLSLYNCTAPIDGTIMSSNLIVGEEAVVGTSGMTISDTSVIYLEAQVDEMDIGKVYVGMSVEVNQYEEMYFYGEVVSISMEGVYEYGVSYFPATIMLYNDGVIQPGMYLNYSFVANQNDDCIIVPVQAVKYTEEGTCLFIRSDEPPENAVELGEDVVPEGFYAVPVEVGLSDDYGAEIISGVDEGVEVFTQYIVDQAGSWMMYG